MATITHAEQWPKTLMKEQSMRWGLQYGTQRSEPTLDGTIQVTSMRGGPLWTADFSTIALRTQDDLLTWQALQASLDGGTTPVDVPLCLHAQTPWPLALDGKPITMFAQIPFSDLALFSDQSHFGQRVILIKTAASAVARAVDLRIEKIYGGVIKAGMHFSYMHPIYGWRLYRIAKVYTVNATTFDLKIRPPLRAAIAANEGLEFDRPRCVMRLPDEDAMDLEIEMRSRARPSASFVEAF